MKTKTAPSEIPRYAAINHFLIRRSKSLLVVLIYDFMSDMNLTFQKQAFDG